ncbi:MAG: NAD(+) synthase [Candidatus Zixiibacteriota bacterium]
MVVQLKPDILKLDNPVMTIERIENFIRDYVDRAGSEGVVLGMSGGLDSSVVAALCSRALSEKNKVLGLCLPEDENFNQKNIDHAEQVANMYNIDFKIINISEIIRNFFVNIPIFRKENKVSNGNVKARIRALTLFYYSNVLNRLVVGTTDKSEMMLG